MKRLIVTIAGAISLPLLWPASAGAFPGERIPYRAAHFARKVVYKIDQHVVRPTRHAAVRHLPD